MRLKSTEVCCAFAWAPGSLGSPAMLATASYHGAMDDDFSNEGSLEIRLVDATRTDETDVPILGRVRILDRACRVDWSPHTGGQGIIAVAYGNGSVYIFSAASVLDAGSPAGGTPSSVAPLCTIQQHKGAVRGCQFNPSHPHYLATAGDDGQWFVWTLQNPREPQKIPVIANAAHDSAIVHVQWHPKYQYIIATAAANGMVNVWNLKTQNLATALNVAKNFKAGVNCIAWNPTIATQLAIGLDDVYPVVQMWDLKRTMAPMRELKDHRRGISSLAWNKEDPTMLASCDSEGRTLWWDPNTGVKRGELAAEAASIIDVQWCPALSSVLATSSFSPLLCVSTALDQSGTSGEAGATVVPNWLKRPCPAAINAAFTVATLVPGTTATLRVYPLSVSPMSPKSNEEMNFQEDLHRHHSNSPERIEWLKKHNYGLLAAVASSQTNRQPILNFLSQEESKPVASEEDDPFAQIAQEHQKSYEDRASEQVVCGNIEAAVDICMDNGRYDDAFAVAFLRGGSLLGRVHQRYVEYVTARHAERRHVLYVGTIASGDFSAIASTGAPWKEALSAIVAFAGEGFAGACNSLGDSLKAQGNYEGAYACYVCSRNVDAIVDLWQLQGVPSLLVVRNTTLVEETTQRASTRPYLAHCLCDYGLKLVHEGHANVAVPYLHRAANIGDRMAAAMINRLQFLIPLQMPSESPFQSAPIADAPSPACEKLFAQMNARNNPQPQAQPQQHPQEHPQAQPQQYPQAQPQQYPQAQPQQYPQAQRQQYEQVQPQPPYPQQQQLQGQSPVPSRQPSLPQQVGQPPASRPPLLPRGSSTPTANTPQHYHDPRAAPSAPFVPPQPSFPSPQSAPPQQLSHPSPVAQSPQLTPPGSSFSAPSQPKPRLMPHPVSSYSSLNAPPHVDPGRSLHASVPRSGAGGSAPYQAMAPFSYSSAPPHPSGTVNGSAAPPLNGAPQMGYAPSSTMNTTAPTPFLPQPAGQVPPPPQAPQSMPPPGAGPGAAVTAPPMPRPALAPGHLTPGSSNLAGHPVGIAAMDANHFPHPLQQQIVRQLQTVICNIADANRRAAIEQSAVEMCRQMQQNRLPEALLQRLLNVVMGAGTPAAKAAWQQVTMTHYNECRSFYNLGLL